ncbi:MAG: hypothetical protein M3164_00520 [Actinomycetota bacterium]|nr:hypothetical protein [Actinomycetota bacterium]
MANWRCPECNIVMDAEDEGRLEACPFCGLDMDPVVRGEREGMPAWISVYELHEELNEQGPVYPPH